MILHENINLENIHEYGIRGPIAFFIEKFILNGVFRVKIADECSAEFPQQQGAPQGSILSVTLFSIAISDILHSIPRDIGMSLYVDDLVIYYAAI